MAEHRPGDILLTQITGQVGQAIRIGQWLNGDGFTEYEHAAIYIGDEFAHHAQQLVEAEPGGARVAELAEYAGRPQYWSTGELTLTEKQRYDIVNAALGYIGVGYSFADYAALASRRLHLWAPGLRRYIANSKHMICSQLVDQCYQDADVHLFTDKRWPGDVTPGDLYHAIAHQ